MRSTLQIEREALNSGIHDLAPQKVYLAKFIAESTGALLPHLLTLTLIAQSGLFSAALSVKIDFHQLSPFFQMVWNSVVSGLSSSLNRSDRTKYNTPKLSPLLVYRLIP